MYKFELYQDESGRHRWRFTTPDGDPLAESATGYVDRRDCLAAIDRLKIRMPGAPLA